MARYHLAIADKNPEETRPQCGFQPFSNLDSIISSASDLAAMVSLMEGCCKEVGGHVPEHPAKAHSTPSAPDEFPPMKAGPPSCEEGWLVYVCTLMAAFPIKEQMTALGFSDRK